jgi:dGTPase
LVKHNGPLTDRSGHPVGRYKESGLPEGIRDYAAMQDLQLWSFASAEAQVAAIADDIAYDAHDIDDGLRAGLFGLDDLTAVPLLGDIIREIHGSHPGLDPVRIAHELVRRVITRLIEDVVAESTQCLAALAPRNADDVRLASRAVIGFSAGMAAAEQGIKDFLYPRMYRHERVMSVMNAAQGVVRDLVRYYLAHPADMPEEWQDDMRRTDERGRIRHTGDFIAGMTDRYALAEHARHFETPPELR